MTKFWCDTCSVEITEEKADCVCVPTCTDMGPDGCKDLCAYCDQMAADLHTDHRVWNSLPPCGIEPEDDHCFYCESQSHRSENCPTLLFFCS